MRRFKCGVPTSVALVGFASLFLSSFAGCTNESPKLLLPDHPEPVVAKKPTYEKGVVVQGDRPPVDILFVIDDSSSMDPYQRSLSKNIERFLQSFLTGSMVDYHIGVITSTTGSYSAGSDGKLVGWPKYVDRSTPNGLLILQRQLLVGTNGSGTEKFFLPVKEALTEPNLSGFNSGFYRPEAYLAIVFVTDADDQSQNEVSLRAFTDFMRTLKAGHPEKLINYAVIIPSTRPDSADCVRDGAGPPFLIEAYMQAVMGLSLDLCGDEFGSKLAAIGSDLSFKVGSAPTLYLSRKPVESTIQVTYGTQTIPRDPQTGWSYDSGRIALVFGDKITWSVQPFGTQVQVGFIPADVTPAPSRK